MYIFQSDTPIPFQGSNFDTKRPKLSLSIVRSTRSAHHASECHTGNARHFCRLAHSHVPRTVAMFRCISFEIAACITHERTPLHEHALLRCSAEWADTTHVHSLVLGSRPDRGFRICHLERNNRREQKATCFAVNLCNLLCSEPLLFALRVRHLEPL